MATLFTFKQQKLDYFKKWKNYKNIIAIFIYFVYFVIRVTNPDLPLIPRNTVEEFNKNLILSLYSSALFAIAVRRIVKWLYIFEQFAKVFYYFTACLGKMKVYFWFFSLWLVFFSIVF